MAQSEDADFKPAKIVSNRQNVTGDAFDWYATTRLPVQTGSQCCGHCKGNGFLSLLGYWVDKTQVFRLLPGLSA